MTIKSLIRQNWQIIFRNKYGFLLGASLTHFLMSVVGVNLLFWLFRLILIISGQPNLNKDNFFAIIFSNPLSIVLSVSYVLLVAFLTFVEFSILFSFVEFRRSKKEFSLKKSLAKSIFGVRKILGPQMIFFVLYFIAMVPLENLGLSSAITERLRIPEFIVGEISKTNEGLILYGLIILAIFYFNFRLIFTLPLVVLRGKTLFQSVKTSWNLTRKNLLKIFTTISVLQIGLILVCVLFSILAIPLLFATEKLFGFAIFRATTYTFIDSILFIFSIMTKIIIVNVLISFIKWKNSDEEFEPQKRRNSRAVAIFAIILLFSAMISNGFQIYSSKIGGKISKISHRGDIYGGVENSLEALESAKKKGADFVEVDIQITRDKKFAVIHDYNLLRLAGEDKNVRDLTLAELQQVKIRSGNFESRIPSFEEYVEESKKIGANLLIEIKPNGGEPENFAEIFVAEMKKLGIEKKFKVMSLDLDLIRKIETLTPEINTGFVIPLQFGDFDGSKVDFYVIEDFSYRRSLAENAHANHRKIFVWTINSRAEISKYLNEPVDGIITDELELFSEVKNESDDANFNDFIRIISLRF